MMTKKDYIRIAKALRESYPDGATNAIVAWHGVTDRIIHALQEDNPRFDVDRFTVAAVPD